MHGITVAWVLPDVKEVLAESHKLAQLPSKLGMKLDVVPVNSVCSGIRRAEDTLRHHIGC